MVGFVFMKPTARTHTPPAMFFQGNRSCHDENTKPGLHQTNGREKRPGPPATPKTRKNRPWPGFKKEPRP